MKPVVSFLISIPAIGMLVACADTDRVNFVTTTNIAIDADATTQSVSIGYHRYEGYVGPAYDTGAIPPIVAKISSNLSILAPEVHQFYGTGKAAVLATCKGGAVADQPPAPAAGAPAAVAEDGVACPPPEPPPPLSGEKRIMFFGTGSVIGFRVRWAGNVPESVTLGYKRKEFSTLPIGSREAQPSAAVTAGTTPKEDRYGSVLASLDMKGDVGTRQGTRLELGQFFATGVAAENLANKQVVRKAVEEELTSSLAESLQIVSVQETVTSTGELTSSLAARIEQTYFTDPDQPDVITDMEAFRRVQDCMARVGAPSDDPNDLLLNPDFQRFQEPVARCLGLVS